MENNTYIQLYNDDCVKRMKELPDNSIDIILTSPPYNFGMEYSTYEDKRPYDEYLDWLLSVWKECYRILKDDGRIIVNIQPISSDGYLTHHDIAKQLIDIGFKYKAEILWEKNNYNCAYTTWGSWKSPSAPYIKYSWEFIYVFCKNDLTHKGNKENIDITDEEFKQYTYGKWSIAPEINMKKYNHPAMFPEELPYRCLKLFSYQGDTVLDPFMGTGTTGVVCKKLKRNFIGIELDKEYFNTAKQRIDDVFVW